MPSWIPLGGGQDRALMQWFSTLSSNTPQQALFTDFPFSCTGALNQRVNGLVFWTAILSKKFPKHGLLRVLEDKVENHWSKAITSLMPLPDDETDEPQAVFPFSPYLPITIIIEPVLCFFGPLYFDCTTKISQFSCRLAAYSGGFLQT